MALSRLPLLSVFVLSILFLTGCDDDDPVNTPSSSPAVSTITSTVVADDRFDTLEAALIKANLADTFADESGSFTVFAPTDDAFTALLNRLGITANDLLNLSNLGDILGYHVVNGEVDATAAKAVDGGTVPTLFTNNSIMVDDLNGSVLINNAVVVIEDIKVENGIIHVIDTVLMPPVSIYQNLTDYGFSTLKAAVDNATLNGTLDSGASNLTVLAPTDAAFTQFLTDSSLTATELLNNPNLDQILLNHVINGSVPASSVASLSSADTLASDTLSISADVTGITIDGNCKVTTANLLCSNGLIHVIDYVIAPPLSVNQ